MKLPVQGSGRGYALGLPHRIPVQIHFTDGNRALQIAAAVRPEHALAGLGALVALRLGRALWNRLPSIGDGMDCDLELLDAEEGPS